jgi:hypothetical protein
MPVITCIDDLKRLHKRRTPKMFYDYCESGSYTEQTFRENTTDFQKLRLRQKVAVDMLGRRTEADDRPQGGDARGPCPVGMTGHATRRWRDQGRARRRKGGRALHVVHHVDLFHRGYRRTHQGALLVPALRDADEGFVDSASIEPARRNVRRWC